MSALTASQAIAGPVPALDYPMPLRRGSYVARIVGPHGRFGLDRDFLRGRTNRRAGRVVYRLTPGWYEIQDRPGRRELVAVTTAGTLETVPMPTTPEGLRLLGKAGRRGETLDTPGAWSGVRCWCGADVAAYTAAGRARCDDHA